jgi:hypothetical protein
MRRVVTMGLALTVVAGSLRPHAQGPAPLAHVRDLYSRAAYEDVVSAVDADVTDSPQIGQYKVFSLIALGRPKDAEQAAEAVLAGDLGFHPDTDASPRLIALFATVRLRLAPERLMSMYSNAKGFYDRKDRDGAIRAFTEIIDITADPDLKGDKTIAELGLLANGFLDLSRALPTPTAPTGAGKSSATPEKTSATDTVLPPDSRNSAPGIAAVPPIPTVVSLAQPIREEFPQWLPPSNLRRAEYRGRILVHVGVDGKVTAAEIIDSIHPLYDELLMRASRGWLYKPGLINGTPVPSDHIVEVVLQPRLDLPH